ncbi:hypothetical protein, partial [Ligilactobacillus sp.]|uniref:hypothetical protein n=1 Tax=Ligilactobacillus sp. TaxID=2767921 RepID=UPI002FDF3D66
LGGDFAPRPPNLVEISCLTHQTWWKICASPTKLGGNSAFHPPSLVENNIITAKQSPDDP